MIDIDQSVREFTVSVSGGCGATAPFFIDKSSLFQFFINIPNHGYFLDSRCYKTAVITLEFQLWLKNLDYIQTDEGIVHRHTYVNENGCGYRTKAESRTPYVRDGKLTVCCRIRKAAILSKATTEVALFSKKPELCDCTIRVDNKSFPASKYVLGVQSDVFASMWTVRMKEGKPNEVKIQGFDEETVKNMINYTHSFGTVFPTANTEGLYRIAHKYQIEPLKIKCIEFMTKTITVDNFCNRLQLAFEYSLDTLKTAVLHFARTDQNKKLFVNSKVYDDLGENNFALLTEILRALHK